MRWYDNVLPVRIKYVDQMTASFESVMYAYIYLHISTYIYIDSTGSFYT